MFTAKHRFAMLHTLSAAVTGLTLACGMACADVHNYGGDIWAGVETNPPSNCDLRRNSTEDNQRTRVYREHDRVPLPQQIFYNATGVGTYQQTSTLVRKAIPDADRSTVSSYIFHFDPTNNVAGKRSRGWVEFTHPIYVISQNADLDASDVYFGMPCVHYPTSFLADRGYDLAASDAFWISKPSANVWRLTFDVFATSGVDQVRVIEVVEVLPPPPPRPRCPADRNGDHNVDFHDVAMFLNDFSAGTVDFNQDGATDFADLVAFLEAYGQDCYREGPNPSTP
jgi:hypothetical protein